MHAREPALEAPQLVLASASPRRADLLSQIGLTFVVRPSNVVESLHEGDSDTSASAVTQRLALLKAINVAECFDDAIIIGADTLVSFETGLLGKPTDDDDAFEVLTRLSGACHQVVTGVALVDACTGREVVWSETTQVYFREVSADEINAYIATGEAADKAGAYGIQGRGATFVRRIDGCYFNVVGLPLASFVEHLSNFRSHHVSV